MVASTNGVRRQETMTHLTKFERSSTKGSTKTGQIHRVNASDTTWYLPQVRTIMITTPGLTFAKSHYSKTTKQQTHQTSASRTPGLGWSLVCTILSGLTASWRNLRLQTRRRTSRRLQMLVFDPWCHDWVALLSEKTWLLPFISGYFARSEFRQKSVITAQTREKRTFSTDFQSKTVDRWQRKAVPTWVHTRFYSTPECPKNELPGHSLLSTLCWVLRHIAALPFLLGFLLQCNLSRFRFSIEQPFLTLHSRRPSSCPRPFRPRGRCSSACFLSKSDPFAHLCVSGSPDFVLCLFDECLIT